MNIDRWLAFFVLALVAACAIVSESGAALRSDRISVERRGSEPGASSRSTTAPNACASPEHRSLDFMIGEWRVVETASGKDFAQNRVEPVDGGCAIRESLRHPGGLVGSSTIFFGPADQLWHAFYHDSLGFYAHLTGVTNVEGRQELTGDVRFPAEAHRVRKARQVIFKDGAGRPRQIGYLLSADDVSWQMIYDLTFCAANRLQAETLPPCSE